MWQILWTEHGAWSSLIQTHTGNYVWDFSLAFTIGKYHSIGSADTFVITGDKRIKEAATEAGCKQHVIDLDEYLASIRNPGTPY